MPKIPGLPPMLILQQEPPPSILPQPILVTPYLSPNQRLGALCIIGGDEKLCVIRPFPNKSSVLCARWMHISGPPELGSGRLSS